MVKDKLTDLTVVKNKVLYWAVINNKLQEPTAIEKWIERFPFLESAPWHKIYGSIHTITQEPYMQSFQYKIFNRILNCNYNLYIWKIKDSPLCNYCGLTDTIDHHLFYCTDCELFWTKTNTWITQVLKIKNNFEYSVCEILFGIGLDTKELGANEAIQNLVILMGKWYINKTRTENNPLHFRHFLRLVKMKLEAHDRTFVTPDNIERVDENIILKIKQILSQI